MIIISHKTVDQTLMMISHKTAFRIEQQGALILKRIVKLIKASFLQEQVSYKGLQMQLLMPSTKQKANCIWALSLLSWTPHKKGVNIFNYV